MAGPTPKKQRDHKAKLAEAKLAERSVEVCLRADLFAEMQEIERDLQRAESTRKSADGSLASGTASRELASRFETLRAEMLQHTLTLRFRALPRKRKRTLELEHPPREQDLADVTAGCNIETMSEALVHACLISPEFDADDWIAFDATMSDGQWQLMVNAVWAINARDVEIPFSRTASRITQTSDES